MHHSFGFLHLLLLIPRLWESTALAPDLSLQTTPFKNKKIPHLSSNIFMDRFCPDLNKFPVFPCQTQNKKSPVSSPTPATASSCCRTVVPDEKKKHGARLGGEAVLTGAVVWTQIPLGEDKNKNLEVAPFCIPIFEDSEHHVPKRCMFVEGPRISETISLTLKLLASWGPWQHSFESQRADHPSPGVGDWRRNN